VLSVCRAESPLKILKPKNHGTAAWAIAATFGGGLVAGDRIALSVDVERGASLFLGSQSSQKAFRGASSTRVDARVRDGALLVLWPDPLACFHGADHVQNTLIEVDEGGSVVVLDAYTAGRPAHEPPFSFASLRMHTRVTRAGAPAFIDGVRIERDALPRFAEMRAFATLFACGPRADLTALAVNGAASPDRIDSTTVAASDRAGSTDCVASAHSLDGGRTVVRVAATRADRLAHALAPFTAAIARELGDNPFGRRGETSLKQDAMNVTPADDEALPT
jgi:urease accessory protein